MSEKLKEYERKLNEMVRKGKDKGDHFTNLVQEYWALQDALRGDIGLTQLTPQQKAQMKVEHYKIHIPAYATREQLQFIQNIAQAVMKNEPITIVHEKAMQFLLRIAYTYRNTLTEFDEQDRWSEEDDMNLNKISAEFRPILDWLVEQYKLNIGKFRRD